ncbi:MAG: type I glutamate--ammonia ligase [Trueperaceae bacterium]|nr:MAG: type I glutamate--ammonia ligase [Trueperaceae bacterium]
MLKNQKEVFKFIKDQGVEFVDVRFIDPPGRWQHFTMPADGLDADAFEEGLGFDGSSIQGFEGIQSSDLLLFLDPTTAFIDPFMANKTLVLVADITDPRTGQDYGKDPRRVAKRAEAYMKDSGIADTAYLGPEAEFFIFDSVSFNTDPYSFGFSFKAEDAHTDGDASSDGYYIKNKGGYFPAPPSDKYQDLRSQMVNNLEAVGIPVEKHHHEVATAGQAEIDVRFDSLLSMADKLVKYKYVVRNTAVMAGKTATFMAKPIYGDNGSGMHVHISLWKGGKPLFYEKGGYADLSEMAGHFVAGLFAHAPAMAAFTNPTFNSYRRLVRGFEAPVNLIMSASNRSAIVRVPGYSLSPKAKNVEYRGPDPTANPYLCFSALLMAGLDGIKKEMGPPPTTDKNLFDLPARQLRRIKQLPESLAEALDALEKDNAFLLEGGVFTKELIESYIELKRDEIEQVWQHPNPMEFDLYFDL